MFSVRVRLDPGGVELEVCAGERLLDAADDYPELGLPAACRAGNCGACLLRVRAGGEGLAEPGAIERHALSELHAAPDQRLGCQLRIRADLGADARPIVVAIEPA